MKIKLKNYKQASAEKISSVEKELNIKLPDDYTSFISQYDGAISEENIFDKKLLLGISRFVPIKKIYALMRGIEGLPTEAIVFAEGHGGEYLYINKTSNKIFFWDHEVEDDKEIATNFANFLEMLEPFDFDAVYTAPPKVLGGWVDPDYKPNFE